MTAQIVTTREALLKAVGKTPRGLVPTMGALHAGHLSLIARSARENPLTVVSVFVNPTQFSVRDDLDRYPRDLDRDAALAADAGGDIIFAPSVETIYPAGFDTFVEVGRLSRRWEGAARPGHLRGVATVVTILLNLVQPARAYFGEKDYQQLQIVRRLHRDLALPGEIVGCPTVRAEDGLALSSRNERLSAEDRTRARAIPRALDAVRRAAAAGERDVARLEELGLDELDVPGVAVDYLAIVDGDTLEPLQSLDTDARLLVAANVGGTRLIDNAALTPLPTSPGSTADMGRSGLRRPRRTALGTPSRGRTPLSHRDGGLPPPAEGGAGGSRVGGEGLLRRRDTSPCEAEPGEAGELRGSPGIEPPSPEPR